MHVSKHPMGQRLKFRRRNQTPSKKASKKKKVSTFFDSEKIVEDEVDLGLDADNQEVLSQQARDDEVRMISLVLILVV